MTSTTRHRSGLTLLEVLLASAILAMLAGACAPAITGAIRLLSVAPTGRSIEAADLEIVADAFLADPAKFGVKDLSLDDVERLEFNWPGRSDNGTLPPIILQPAQPLDDGSDHMWLKFECDGAIVMRWLARTSRDTSERVKR